MPPESSRAERSAQVSSGEKPSVELPALPIEISNWIGLSANLSNRGIESDTCNMCTTLQLYLQSEESYLSVTCLLSIIVASIKVVKRKNSSLGLYET